MKAIIVPGVTDLNKGDQALVWESVRLVQDTNLYNNVYVITSGDTPEETSKLCSQTRDENFEFINSLLKHPRRGKHYDNQEIKDSFLSKISQVLYGVKDFISRSILLLLCNNSMLLRVFYSKETQKSINKFKSADSIFVKGGGFIHAYGEFKAPYAMWYLLFYIRLANKLKKTVVVLPNSYGPFQGFTVKKQIKNAFKSIDLIYAREQISRDSLTALLNKNIALEQDLGFFLQKKDNIAHILNKYNLKDKSNLIGITVRPWRFPGFDNPDLLYTKYLNSIESFIKYALEHGYIIILCNQSLGPNAHEDDRNAIQAIYSLFEDNENVVWINENLTCNELKSLYSNFKFFVGTRFHSIIFSCTSLVPSIAISYGGNKGNGIMDDLDLGEFVIPIDKINSQILIDKFELLITKQDLIKQKLNENLLSLCKSRLRMIEEIKSIVLK